MPDPIAPTTDELATAQAFWDAHLTGDDWPFSLQIDGARVAGPTGWTVERTIRELDPERQELTLTARHPDHGLALRCVAVRYRRHPVVEWTLPPGSVGRWSQPDGQRGPGGGCNLAARQGAALPGAHFRG